MEVFQKSWITQDITLWSALILTLLLFLAIFVTASSYKLTLFDGITNPDKVRKQLGCMTERQRKAHIWITATLDVAFPLSYGCLFAGAALRFFPKHGNYLAWPALLAILVDLIEGVIQVLALTTASESLKLNNLLKLKKNVTSLKFFLSFLGFFIALAGLLKEVF